MGATSRYADHSARGRGRSMKIGIIYQGIFPSKTGMGGGERRMRDIARGLNDQAGHSVILMTPRRQGSPDYLDDDGLRVVYIGNGGSGFGRRLSFWRGVEAYCEEQGFDWVLPYGVTMDGLLTIWRLSRFGIRIVGEFCDLRSTGAGGTRLSRLAYACDERVMPQLTDLNIVISSTIERHVRHQAPRTPCLRLPVLVDTETFSIVPEADALVREKWEIPETAPLFGYVGGLWKSEGVGYLIEAFAKVLEQVPEARLIVAGRLVEGPAYDDVAAMREKLGLGERLVTTGWVSTDDVRLIYSRADVMILPQIGDAFSTAALPTKLAEYCCMQRSIIATDVGDVAHYVPHGIASRIVSDADVDQLVQEMILLAENPEMRKTLAAGAKTIADEQFDYRRACARLSQHMQNFESSDMIVK